MGHRNRKRQREDVSCLNCGASADGAYCPSCGQSTHEGREPTLGHFLHDLFHEVAHLDGKVFRTLRATPLPDGFKAAEANTMLEGARHLIAAVREGHNSLEVPARQIVPSLDQVLTALSALPGNVVTRMSGGGPTCFGLFDDQQMAKAAAKKLCAAYPNWWVRSTILA